MQNRTCVLEMTILLILAVLLSFGTILERQQQKLSGNVIRLHIRANSDLPEDQTLKLQVRDHILDCTEAILSDCTSRDEAYLLLENHLAVLEENANAFLLGSGSKYQAEVMLRKELFGTRYYDSFALPGGYYDSLIVEIGSGEGRNWWCVVYPDICTASVTDMAIPVMGSTEDMIFPDENGEYDLRFKTLELFENLMGWIRGRWDGIPTSR